MEEGNDGIVQEFTLWKSGGQRVILKIDSEQGNVKYIRKGQVKHSCMIKDLIVTNKDGLQITVNIEHQQKILSAENSQMKEEILKNIKEVIEQHTPKPNIPLNEGSRTIKEGYLIKKGNAVIEKWARRKICVKQGFLIYYPDHSEKIVKLSPVIECHVEAVGTDKFNVIVPERTYSFQIPDTVQDKQEERDDWVRAFNKACCSRTSSELLEDINKENGHNDTCPTEQGPQNTMGNADDENSCRLTILVPPGDTLNVIKKPSRSGTKRPTREHLRRESKEEPP
uniref:PH domain-containing protein n=1 Tax=Magallana gigas TaxID=29159 RepID=A0A8W8L732_MAGGI